MKKNYLRLGAILLILTAILISIMPVQAAKPTTFTCSETVVGVTPGQETYPNGNTHIRGMILQAVEEASDPRLDGGFNTVVVNANLGADGTGPTWGTFRIEIGQTGEDGWEGTFTGHWLEWYNAVGDGFGAYDGMKMWWNMYYGDCSGRIVEH